MPELLELGLRGWRELIVRTESCIESLARSFSWRLFSTAVEMRRHYLPTDFCAEVAS